MTDERIAEYLKALGNEERAAATVEKYRRALLSFAAFLSGAAVTPEMIRLWNDDLRAVDDQHLSGSAERILPFLRLGGLLRAVPQNSTTPVQGQQAGIDASRV